MVKAGSMLILYIIGILKNIRIAIKRAIVGFFARNKCLKKALYFKTHLYNKYWYNIFFSGIEIEYLVLLEFGINFIEQSILNKLLILISNIIYIAIGGNLYT